MSAVQEVPASDRDRRGHEIPIRIDHKPYKAPKPVMTGAELRVLATPPISQEYDLWLENPGPEDDIKVGDDMPVKLKEGMHFYISPKTINPGA
ncbi:MAG TPA: multiubiquitin domain-containing protein [Gemmataceae bacterium]|nr:multiubiquitin domain-containing protein [Gemmataceae bacterium]